MSVGYRVLGHGYCGLCTGSAWHIIMESKAARP